MAEVRTRVVQFLGTLPGRAIVAGAAARLLVSLIARLTGIWSSSLDIVNGLGGVAIVIGLGYLIVYALAAARRRLLWRVRRKLILSYIFIGFVPVILIVAFFLLGALLLFFNFSSYMVKGR